MSQFNSTITNLQSVIDDERTAKVKLTHEVESLQRQLSSTSSELERSFQERNELERKNLEESHSLNKKLEYRSNEITDFKDTNKDLTSQITSAQERVGKLENELGMAKATLSERETQLSTLQRDLDQRKTAYESLDEKYRHDKEELVRSQARLETLNERNLSTQSELDSLRKQVDEYRLREMGRERGDSDSKFSQILNTMREDHDKARRSLEDKNSAMNEQLLRLRDDVRDAETRRSNAEQDLRRAQMEITDVTRKSSVTEAALEIANKV